MFVRLIIQNIIFKMDVQLNNGLDKEIVTVKTTDDSIKEKIEELSEPCIKKVKLEDYENEKKLKKHQEELEKNKQEPVLFEIKNESDKIEMKKEFFEDSKKCNENKELEQNKQEPLLIETKKEPSNKNDELEESVDDTKKNNSDDDMDIDHEIPQSGFNYPLEQDTSDMLDGIEFDKTKDHFPTVTERYLTPYYAIDVQKPCEDVCVYIHSNRICMISLAPSHIILQKNKTITNCNFQISPKVNRLENKVSGKGKRGAQCLQKTSHLCHLTCSDESTYIVRCCMNGKLIEVNDKLVKEPELLKKQPHFGGYIAIVLPNLKYHDEKLKHELLSEKQYEEALEKRRTVKSEETSTEVVTKISDEKKEESIEESKQLSNVKSILLDRNDINITQATAENMTDNEDMEVLNTDVIQEKQNETLNSMEVVNSE